MEFRNMTRRQQSNFCVGGNFEDGSYPAICKLEVTTTVVVTAGSSTIEIISWVGNEKVCVSNRRDNEFKTREETEAWVRENISIPINQEELWNLGFVTQSK